MTHEIEPLVEIPAGNVVLEGNLGIPSGAHGVVIFAHGSGSSRHSPRNRAVATTLHEAGFATLLLDLLTVDEEEIDRITSEHRFDVGLLVARLTRAIDWLDVNEETRGLAIGLFGASTGAAAALVAASERPQLVDAVVSRGGRPDLADDALNRVRAPTLLIVGGNDTAVIGMNKLALEQLATEARLVLIHGATHLFEEPGTLDEVAQLAVGWFDRHLHSRHRGVSKRAGAAARARER